MYVLIERQRERERETEKERKREREKERWIYGTCISYLAESAGLGPSGRRLSPPRGPSGAPAFPLITEHRINHKQLPGAGEAGRHPRAEMGHPADHARPQVEGRAATPSGKFSERSRVGEAAHKYAYLVDGHTHILVQSSMSWCDGWAVAAFATRDV